MVVLRIIAYAIKHFSQTSLEERKTLEEIVFNIAWIKTYFDKISPRLRLEGGTA